MEIRKATKSQGVLIVKPISKQQAKKMIIQNHYSRTWNDGGFGKYNYGIFKEGDEHCKGVAVYGLMKNPKGKIFTDKNPNGWMCELNRLWISDELGHNTETILIAASIRLLKKEDPDIVAIQSFADGRLGCGTIYKAANFQYFGYHYTKFLENRFTGEIKHEQNFTNASCTGAFMKNNISYLIGDYRVFQVKTYRYIYPISRHFKFTFKKRKPYPAYEKGIVNIQWKRDHTHLAGKLVELIYQYVEK